MDIQHDAEWLIHMVENLLSVTKITGGTTNLKKQDEIIEEIVGGVKVSRKKSGAVFTISDNGKGIDPSRIPDIFDGKTQHGSSDSSRGIGIGLSICKSIILAHDGKIFAKNNLNGGASFTFVLPMKGESDYAQ